MVVDVYNRYPLVNGMERPVDQLTIFRTLITVFDPHYHDAKKREREREYK